MVQQLRILAALAENPCLVSSTHTGCGSQHYNSSTRNTHEYFEILIKIKHAFKVGKNLLVMEGFAVFIEGRQH